MSRFSSFAALSLAAVGLAGALLFGALVSDGGQARAANAAVLVGTPANRFTPNVATINVGDSVLFNWSAGSHVVDLHDVSPDLPINSTSTSGTTIPFATAGTYYYYCSIHATAALATEAHVQANDAMVGKIVVAGAASPTATTAVPTATTVPPTATTAPPTPKPTTAVPPTVVAPAPPKTGTGLATSDDRAWQVALALGLLAAAGLGAGGLLLSRRR